MTFIKDDSWLSHSSVWYWTGDKKAQLGYSWLSDGSTFVILIKSDTGKTLYSEVLK